MISTTDPRCGKTWTGLKPEHCTACHETFGTTRAGDRHRKGPFSARYCAPPASVGLVQDAHGVWRLPVQESDKIRLQGIRVPRQRRETVSV